jgi:hypothetical protein
MFAWAPYTIGRDELLTSLQWDGFEVARLFERLDGSWFVILDRHLDWERHITRPCSSLEQGRAGAMMWAERHRERIAREVAERRAKQRGKKPWLPRE